MQGKDIHHLPNQICIENLTKVTQPLMCGNTRTGKARGKYCGFGVNAHKAKQMDYGRIESNSQVW